MNLKEHIAKAIHGCRRFNHPGVYDDWEEEVARDRRHDDLAYVSSLMDESQAAIAAFSEALLSWDSVEAAALAHHRMNLVPNDVPDDVVRSGDFWKKGRDRYYVPEANAALTAAFVKAFGADDDGGER